MTTPWSEHDWWKQLPCPLHPSWGLGDISELDLQKLKRNVDTDENDLMVIELAVYRAFLEFPRGTFYNQGRNNPAEALKYLGLAREHISAKFEENIEAIIGYGIVINTFHMWIRVDSSIKSLLRDLIARKNDRPKHRCYIDITQAYILSRLGPRWRNRALCLYESALEGFPDNWQWLFGKALMVGREARQLGYQKTWKDKELQDKFQKEKYILEKILELNPDFNLARAFYGQALFSLGEQGASEEISLALQREPHNHSIAMVAVRYHRKQRRLNWAEIILKKLLENCNTAETNFQLGLLYRSRAFSVSISEKLSHWRTALTYFDKGKELDLCHYPCYTKRAEMNALLGETKKAQEMFEELFDHIFKDVPYLADHEMIAITTALDMRLPRHKQLFKTEQVIMLSHRYITLATEKYLVTMEDSADNVLVRGKIKKRLEKLEEIVGDDGEELCVRRLATLKLADANRRLGKFEEAEQLYMKIHMQVAAAYHTEEILWGLGKCYFSQGFIDKANVIAGKLERMDEHQVNVHELYADVYLRVAKSQLANETGLSFNDRTHRLAITENLEQAIEKGSLEACYLFLTKVVNIHEHFFTLHLRVPEILAKIRHACDNNNVSNVHTQFKLKLSNGSEIVHDEMTKRHELMEMVNQLFKYDNLINENTCFSEEVVKEYKQLELLRQARLEFEYEILKRKGGESWNDDCKEKLTEVLRIARVVLDHIVHIYQTLVLEKPPGRSLFAIHFDWNKARVDPKLTEEKLKKWVSSSFPGYDMPESVIEIILEVQPMYDKDNLWLAALGSFNSTIKHKSYVGEETFDVELKEAEWIRLRSEDIVRRSCQEVERLVLYFLTLFNSLKRDITTEHAESTKHETENKVKKTGEGEGIRKQVGKGSETGEAVQGGEKRERMTGTGRSQKRKGQEAVNG